MISPFLPKNQVQFNNMFRLAWCMAFLVTTCFGLVKIKETRFSVYNSNRTSSIRVLGQGFQPDMFPVFDPPLKGTEKAFVYLGDVSLRNWILDVGSSLETHRCITGVFFQWIWTILLMCTKVNHSTYNRHQDQSEPRQDHVHCASTSPQMGEEEGRTKSIPSNKGDIIEGKSVYKYG